MIFQATKKTFNDNIYKKTEKTTVLDYRDIIVKKPWGYEFLIFENKHVAIWVLHIVRKRKTSMHCHPKKRTSLVLLSGDATFKHIDGTYSLKPMDAVIIGEGCFHSTEAHSQLPMTPISENGIWVIEIESPPLKTDLIRLEDEYGRKGVSYEGADNMIFKPKLHWKLEEPKTASIVKKTIMNYMFTVIKGGFKKDQFIPSPNALVSVIGKSKNSNINIQIGEVLSYSDFVKKTKGKSTSDMLLLTIEKGEALMKVSDYIFSFIADLGIKEIFAVCGGNAMHLVDSAGKNENLKYIAMHHEQAASMAAEGYANISGKPGAVLVTSGPGVTNTLTGVSGAWINSTPIIFVSGQVTSDTLIGSSGLRQFGVQESNTVDLVKSITKYAVTVIDPKKIKYHMLKAAFMATSGRPGPVWIDVPLDVQSAIVNIDELEPFMPEETIKSEYKTMLKKRVTESIKLLLKSKRPVLISGYGIRIAKAEKEYFEIVEKLGIPVVSSWTTSDLIPTNYKNYIGRSGIMGDRGGNFTVQNSDLLLIIGSRMSIPQVGYNYKTFAREAKKIMVDIDEKELKKPSLIPDIPVNADAKDYIIELLRQLEEKSIVIKVPEWLEKCRQWKRKYPVLLPEYSRNKNGVNSFYFINLLSEKLTNDAVVITDMGTSFTCTMQTFKIKVGQRLYTSSGHASMGFGLPGAIGACYANNLKKTICISGEGGLQMNLQELQTVAHNKLPIILFVLNNGGYLTIKLMQQNHFGRYTGSEASSGLSFPDIIKIAKVHGIKAIRISSQNKLNEKLDNVLSEPGPFVCEIIMPENQPLIPRSSSLKKPDGSIISKPLEDLYPFLNRQEFMDNMIIEPVEVLKDSK